MGIVDYRRPTWTADYTEIANPWPWVEEVLELNPPWIVVDTETGYNPLNRDAVIRFIGGQPNNEPFMFTFHIPGMGNFSCTREFAAFGELFKKFQGMVINHNIKFDLHMFLNIGLPVPKKLMDTMVMVQILTPEFWCLTPDKVDVRGNPVLDKDGNPEKGRMRKSKALKNISYHYLEAGGLMRPGRALSFPHMEGTQWLEDAVDRARAKLGRLTGKGKRQVSYRDVWLEDPVLMSLYATVDVHLVSVLWGPLYEELVADGMLRAYEQDMAATLWLLNCERRGVRMDTDRMQRDDLLLTGIIDELEQAILGGFGSFNINSGRDLAVKVTQQFGVRWVWKTESGEVDTSKERLNYVAKEHPETAEFLELVLRYRYATHIRDTYIRGVLPLIQKGRIHADLLLAPMDDSSGATVTGRLSSMQPNLQNIPKKHCVVRGVGTAEVVVEPRAYYIPDEGCVFVRMDGDQQEYRMLGHYSNDKVFMSIIEAGQDIHKGTAANLYKKPYDEVTSEERDIGKRTNFALVYQLGNVEYAVSLGHKLDKELCKMATRHIYNHIPAYKLPHYGGERTLEDALNTVSGAKPRLREAIAYFFTEPVIAAIRQAGDEKRAYFAQFPDMKPFLEDVKAKAKTRGWVMNFYGRKYYFANPARDNYKGPNYVIQGSCSGVCKDRGVASDNYLLAHRQSELTYSFLPIHDELCFQIHLADLGLVLPLNKLLADLPFRVPMTWGMDWGHNLHERIDINTQEDVDKVTL